MNPLRGVDAAFLYLETPETPMHVASLHLLDVPAAQRERFHAEVKREVAARLHWAPVFLRSLVPMPFHVASPVWVTTERIDLDHHVKHLTLPRPGTQAQLDDCVGRLHSRLLDRSRPLWQLHVIDGLQSGQVAYYFKVHHAVLDGQAGIMLSEVLFDDAVRTLARSRLRSQPGAASGGGSGAPVVVDGSVSPGALALLGAAVKHDAEQYVSMARHVPVALKTLVGLLTGPPASSAGHLSPGHEPRRLAPGPAFERSSEPVGASAPNFVVGPRTRLNQPITAARSFAGVSIPMRGLKRLAAAHDATLNDLVLALCSGALRRYLVAHGGLPPEPLIATMPISLRDVGNTEYRTQATLSLVNLHTDVDDPERRLHAIRDAAGVVKALARQARGVVPMDFPSITLPWMLSAFAWAYGRSGLTRLVTPFANVVISNIPGPVAPLYAAGARMTAYWPLSIVEHGLGLNVTAVSYAGAMGFGFTAARTLVPDARPLADALVLSLRELKACTRRSSAESLRHSRIVSARSSVHRSVRQAAPAESPPAPPLAIREPVHARR